MDAVGDADDDDNEDDTDDDVPAHGADVGGGVRV